jgi:hypothetical protein
LVAINNNSTPLQQPSPYSGAAIALIGTDGQSPHINWTVFWPLISWGVRTSKIQLVGY